MKWKIGIVLIIGILIAIPVVMHSKNKKKGADGYEAVKLERTDIKEVVSSAGTITAYRQIEVKSKASGEILRIHVKEGDQVKKGQLLLELDKTDELSSVRQYRASLMAAQARVIQAEEKLKEASRNYEQQSILAAEKLITQEQLLQSESNKNMAQADLTIQQASLLSAREQLRSAEQRFADTEIRAPIDGVVLQQLVEEGQIIASGISSNSGGTLIFMLGDVSRIITKAEIDEVDISKVYVGQKVDVLVDAYESRKFEAVLTQVAPQAVNKSNVAVFDVEIEVTDTHKDLLKPGMTATAEIIVNGKNGVLAVPSQAIVTRKRKSFVYVKEKNEYVQKIVRKGIEDDEYTEIVSGLKGYDTVYMKKVDSMNERNGRGGPRNSMRMMGRMGR